MQTRRLPLDGLEGIMLPSSTQLKLLIVSYKNVYFFYNPVYTHENFSQSALMLMLLIVSCKDV
jgi:hypothetical protein